MNKKIIFLVLAITLSSALIAQQKNWSMRGNAGLSSGGSAYGHRWLEGYYFSFDVGVPLFKGFEVAPNFTYASMLPNIHINNEWTSVDGIRVNGDNSRDKKKSEIGENMSALSILLHIKPFDYIKNEKFLRHQVILGGGISYVSYTMIRCEFQYTNSKNLIINHNESSRSFQPYYGKVGYNYMLKKDTMIGLVGSWQGIKKKEAQFLLGFQFGVRF